MIYHGYPRFTGDTDIFYDREPGNVSRLHQALKIFWSDAIPGGLTEQDLLRPDTIVQFGMPPQRIDLINQIDGVSFEAAWKGRVTETIPCRRETLSIAILGKAELLTNKRASARSKDLDDLENLA